MFLNAAPRNHRRSISLIQFQLHREENPMRKTALVLTTVGTLGLTSIAAPAPAEARGWGWGGWGWGGAVAGGLLAGAVIGGIASSAAWGPGYGYYGGPYGYYGGGYAPAYAWGGPAYGGYAYDDVYPAYGYSTVTYGYGPSYYGYRRVVRPAYAYYGGPRVRVFHHRWHGNYWHR
jgi:hypothetical protein